MQFFGGSEISPSPPVPTATGNNVHMMYIFNRSGVCLFYREWNRPLRTLNPQQDHKLMFGLLFSLKSFTAKMDPTRFIFLTSLGNYFGFWGCLVKGMIQQDGRLIRTIFLCLSNSTNTVLLDGLVAITNIKFNLIVDLDFDFSKSYLIEKR